MAFISQSDAVSVRRFFDVFRDTTYYKTIISTPP
eukprot:SAG11_NODE_28110_length_325_cov_0.911504_2_plen_33_part_01